MNEKINFQQISALVARRASMEPQEVETALRNIFARLADNLVAHSAATLDGIGSFSVTGRGVIFTPDEHLAHSVNAPFAMFEAVELNPGVTADMLEQPDEDPASEPEPVFEQAAIAEPEPETEPFAEPEPVAEPEPGPVFGPEPEPVAELDPVPDPVPDPAIPIVPDYCPEPEPVDDPAEPDIEEVGEAEEEDARSTAGWQMFIIGLITGLALGAAISFFVFSTLTGSPEKHEDTATVWKERLENF
ncbi:MAG: procyclic acidic repetitive family protein [Clostridium sp.]|nr:procyclic acidic repetitive family protein [Clostridium sp.]